jgi:hypothetical protein
MTNVTSYSAELLEFQMPIFHQAINDKKSFDDALAIAQGVPWPEGLSKANLISFAFCPCLPQDAEEEKRKRAARLEDAKRASRKRKDFEKMQRAAKAWDAKLADKAARDKVNPPLPPGCMDRYTYTTHYCDSAGNVLRTETQDVHVGKPIGPDGKPFTLSYCDVSPEVRQAIFLPLHQRRVFGAAIDRGLSEADALAIAKGKSRDEYQDRLTTAWKD